MLQIIKTKAFRIVAILVALLGIYALLGFVVAPRMVRSALLEDIPKAISATPTVGEIHINPFLFQITVDNFALAGSDGSQLLGFRRLFVDFELSSIWHRAYSFGNIDITAPMVSAVVAQNGVLNLKQLQPKPSAQPAQPQPAKKSALPALRIGSFKVSEGLVSYEDHSRPDVFAARIEPINFELREFTTGVEGGKFTFTGSSKQGERLEWHGHVSVDPIESDGEFQVNGLLARTLWDYVQDQVNFDVDSGSIDVAGTYQFALKDAATDNLQVAVSKVALSDFSVRLKQAAGAPAVAPWITVPSLTVTGTNVDLAKRQAHVDLVALSGVKLVTWLEPDGTLNLMKLAAKPAAAQASGATPVTAAPAAPAATPAAAAPVAVQSTSTNSTAPAAGAPWAFDLRQLDIRDAQIDAEDRTVHPEVKVKLAPFSLQVGGASQDLSKPVTVTLDTRIDDKGSLTVSGELTPQPVVANLAVKFADIGLTTIQPYIAQHTDMTLVTGEIGGEAKVHYGAAKDMPEVQLTGHIDVDKVHTVDDALHDEFIDWDRLQIVGLNYSQHPDKLDIEQVVAHKLYARVIIEKDASLNVKRVLRMPVVKAEPPDAATVEAASSGKRAASGSPAAAAATANTARSAKLATVRKHDKARAGEASQASAGAAAGAGMPMSIKKVLLQASQLNFSDFSVQPNFTAGIQDLHGSVVGLSSKPGTRAKVDLKGSVDTFSPVTIAGEMNVLGPLYTDITLAFHNISLPVFNPYSGKFAGYDIAKGKLSTELHYKIDGRKLDAQHHITIEQLEFGNKTDSKEAVTLPVKLAVALLKDRNGVIDLDLPVTGSLDDPKFRLAPIVWKVFVNILEKAVLAPFALLGSLFGGGHEMQFIDFQPGSTTLDPAAMDNIAKVTKALVERPQLKIDVPIGEVPDLDRPALIARAYAAELQGAQNSKGGPKKAAATRNTAAPAFDDLDPATQAELLIQIYAKDFGAEPKFPDTVTSIKSKPDLAAAKVEFLGNAIRQHIVVSDADLQALAQQRAAAMQKALLADPQLQSERVFMVSNGKASANDGAVRLQLALE